MYVYDSVVVDVVIFVCCLLCWVYVMSVWLVGVC